MPRGDPNPQTIASEKYQKKAGYMTKGFKLKRELVEQFESACEKADVSQAGQISRMMQDFIEEINSNEYRYKEKEGECDL